MAETVTANTLEPGTQGRPSIGALEEGLGDHDVHHRHGAEPPQPPEFVAQGPAVGGHAIGRYFYSSLAPAFCRAS